MENSGSIGAGLTDGELEALHELLVECVVYDTPTFEGEEKDHLSNVLAKVTNEAKRRGLWWAR